MPSLLIETEMPGLAGDLSLAPFAIVVGYAIFMLGVCLLACIVSTRGALSVDPTVALRLISQPASHSRLLQDA